jgi:uncharacterized protein YbjT (DUF2867 family)
LIAGASGLVGRELVREALRDKSWRPVQLIVRRSQPAPPGSQVQVVDFRALPALPPVGCACCALGTTIAVAGSEAAFRAVDFDAVIAFAQAAKAAGVKRFACVSALGADAASRNFYSRVKGETEAALGRLGFETLVIARPSLLAGDRASLAQPARAGERLALALTRPLGGLIPKAWRPIEAATLARAMLHALRHFPAGVHVVESGRLQELGGTTPS